MARVADNCSSSSVTPLPFKTKGAQRATMGSEQGEEKTTPNLRFPVASIFTVENPASARCARMLSSEKIRRSNVDPVSPWKMSWSNTRYSPLPHRPTKTVWPSISVKADSTSSGKCSITLDWSEYGTVRIRTPVGFSKCRSVTKARSTGFGMCSNTSLQMTKSYLPNSVSSGWGEVESRVAVVVSGGIAEAVLKAPRIDFGIADSQPPNALQYWKFQARQIQPEKGARQREHYRTEPHRRTAT